MKKQSLIILFALVLFFGISLQSHAGLTTIGQAQYNSQNYNLIWDNDSPFGSIIWLDYTNVYTTWQNQVDWAAGLNGAGVLTCSIDPGYSVTWDSDWRLPATVDGAYVVGYNGTTTAGYNITSSEMGHLFYTELGNSGFYDTGGNPTGCSNCLTITGDFQNLLSNYYWSGTMNASIQNAAWRFGFNNGYQRNGAISNAQYALAVHPGDVTIVPEPISSILFITGGTLLAGRRLFKGRYNKTLE